MLQYLHYIGLGVQPRKTDIGSRLDRDQLPHIINPVEAYLGQSVSQSVISSLGSFAADVVCWLHKLQYLLLRDQNTRQQLILVSCSM